MAMPPSVIVPYYLEELTLSDIRGFGSFRLSLVDDDGSPRMRTVIIGRNGTCKSTLLRALAIALADDGEDTAMLASVDGSLIRQGSKRATIATRLMRVSDGERVNSLDELKPGRSTDRLSRGTSAPHFLERPFLCAYGAGRGIGGSDQGREFRLIDSTATLFRYDSGLAHSELVLRRLQDFLGDRGYDTLVAALLRALGLTGKDSISIAKGGGVTLSGPRIGKNIPLDAWADGYRMTFSWMIDFFGWALAAGCVDEDGVVRGILLVDELEQHLHPSMQAHLLPQLAVALPEVQVIVTTHSPLVALGATPSELVALHRRGTRVNIAETPDFSGYSAEDMLSDAVFFGTDPFPPATRKKLARHRKLAAIPRSKRTSKEQAELARLANQLQTSHATALRDDPVIEQLGKLSELIKRS